MSKADFIGIAMNPGGALKTAAAAAAFFPPVASEGLSMSREDLSIDETLGSRAPSAQEYGGRVYEGDVELAARPNSLPIFLSMFFGSPTSTNLIGAHALSTAFALGALIADGGRLYEVTTAGTTAATKPAAFGTTTTGQTITDGTVVWTDRGSSTGVTIYKHTWNPVAAGKVPLPATLWTINADVTPNIVDQYVGAKGNELSLEVEANGYLMATAGLVAAILNGGVAAPSASRDATKKWAFHQVTAQISVAGGALASVPLLSFGMSYNNNEVTDQFVLGSKEVDSIPDGNIEAEATFTPGANIEGHYRRALLDTPEDVRLLLKAEGAALSGTTTKNTLSIDLKRLQYVEAPVDIDAGETLRSVEVTARPVLDEGSGNLLEVSIINNQTGANYVA